MATALVHGQRGGLAVGLAAAIAGVGLAVRVDHVVLVEAGVLGEALSTAWHGAHVWLLPWERGHRAQLSRLTLWVGIPNPEGIAGDRLVEQRSAP